MKHILLVRTSCLFLCFLLIHFAVHAQVNDVRNLRPFDRILIHPGFDIELVQGETSKVEVISYGIDPVDIHTFVNNGKLEVYHHNFRPPWNNRVGGRWDDEIHARLRITYRHLQTLDFRGDGYLVCKDELQTNELRLRLYGSGEVSLPAIRTGMLKAAIYGDMDLFVGGEAYEQKWKLYGDLELDGYALRGEYVKVNMYGDSEVELDVRSELSLNLFGDGTVNYKGDPYVRRGLIIGDVALRQRY